MAIVLHLIFALLAVWWVGIGLTGLSVHVLCKEKPFPGVRFIIPTMGYVVSLLIFYHGYRWFGTVSKGLIFVVAFSFAINAGFLIVAKVKTTNWSPAFRCLLPQRKDGVLLLVLAGIFILSSWAYLLIGEKAYFHSGNGDIFRVIVGGNEYLSKSPSLIPVEFWETTARLRYISQSFWRLVLQVRGMDAFILQSIVNLFLIASGTFWLVRYVFSGSPRSAIWSAFWSVSASFYFTTYLAGHNGSMMYGSLAPILLGIGLLWSRKELHIGWMLVVAIMIYFLSITYPGPADFILLPAILLIVLERVLPHFDVLAKLKKFHTRNNNTLSNKMEHVKLRWGRVIASVLGGCALMCVMFWAIWLYFEPERVFSTVIRTDESWKIALFKEVWPIFWGIFPSNFVGARSMLHLFIANPSVDWIGVVLSIVLVLFLMLLSIPNHRHKKRRFLFIYIFLTPLYLLMMHFFWGSAYYTYKFLYVNYFVVVIVICLYLDESVRHFKPLLRRILIGIFILLGSMNLLWDVSGTLDILERDYHKKEKIDEFIAACNANSWTDVYLDIPDEVSRKVFGHLFKERDITIESSRSHAEYLIRQTSLGSVVYNKLDTSRTLFENDLLKISKPVPGNDVFVTGYYTPDNLGQISINWIGNAVSERNRNIGRWVFDAFTFIQQEGIADKTYLDISERDSYITCLQESRNLGLRLSSDPEKTHYWLRLRAPSDSIYETFYAESPSDKVIWENRAFRIVEIPADKRKLPLGIDQIVSVIKQNGNEVFLDLPPYEAITGYLVRTLNAEGITLSPTPDVGLVCRFQLQAPFQDRSYKTIVHPLEKVLVRVSPENAIGYKFEIIVVSMPKIGRTHVQPAADLLTPSWFLLSRDLGDFNIYLSRLDDKARYVRFLIGPGPSIDYQPFTLIVHTYDGRAAKRFSISPPLTSITIDLNEYMASGENNIAFHLEGENLVGHSLLPLEERFLNYAIFAVELTDKIDKYSQPMLSVLNYPITPKYGVIFDKLLSTKDQGDIVSNERDRKIWLGTGWYQREVERGQVFRWANRDAELVFRNVNERFRNARVQLEPGPACGNTPLSMNVWYMNHLLCNYTISGKQTIKVPLPVQAFESSGRDAVLTIKADTPQERIPSDSRILGFRVFRVTLGE